MVDHEPAAGPAALPTRLRQDWPVPWQPVWGTEDGFGARVTSALALGALGLAARLPDGVVDLLIGGLARIARRADRRHSESARGFLRQALGDMPRAELERRVLQAYRQFLRVTVDMARFEHRVPVERTLEHFEVEWSEEARKVCASAGGSIILSCHLGSWEAGFAAAPWAGFDPVYGVAKPPNNRPLSVALQRQREVRGVRLLPRRGAMSAAKKVLEAGGTVGMVLDQRARKRPLIAPFFGRPARCDRSAAVLLKRLRVPVVIAACYLTERPLYYSLVFDEVFWPQELAGESLEGIVTRINQAFERLILAHPEQYFWLHDRFKDTPETFEDDKEDMQEGATA